MSNSYDDSDLRKTTVEPHRPFPSLPASKAAEALVGESAEAGEDKGGKTLPARPMFRPPMAILWVLDDGGESAELVRIRTPSFVVGRTQGDFLIPHDNQISSRHAEIVRDLQNGQYRWLLRDLGSRNGTFVRVRGAVLKNDAHIMLGRRRFRFEPAPPAPELPARPPERSEPQILQTYCWTDVQSDSEPPGFPALIELLAAGEGRRFPLTQDSQVLGRDRQQCDLAVPEDPTLSPQHARIWRDANDRWHIEDLGSVNDIWLRITEIPLTSRGCFMLGEQVFALAIP